MDFPKSGIAFFDSGIGGMTTLFASMAHFDGGDFYYYDEFLEVAIRQFSQIAFRNIPLT